VRLRRTAFDKVRFAAHDVRHFVGRVYEGAAEANVPFLASGLTFDALLAAVPFLFLVLSVAGYVLSARAGRLDLQIHEYLMRFLPSSAAAEAGASPFAPAIRLFERVVAERSTLGLLGVPLFLWFSTRLFGSLRATLCEVFDIEETRSWLRGKLHDIALVIVTTILLLLNTLLSEGVELLLRLRPLGVDLFGFLSAQIVAFAVVVTLFVVVFRYVPARAVRLDTVMLAAAICAIGFAVAKHFLGLWFQAMVRPDSLVSDATVGGLLLFVVWTYYMCFVFLIGGQIAQTYELSRRQRAQRAVLH
jgi:membrane protein